MIIFFLNNWLYFIQSKLSIFNPFFGFLPIGPLEDQIPHFF
jgi:hypothetical protein